jgi:hypothetical protein
MRDVLAATRKAAQTTESGDLVFGVFLPPERLAAVLRGENPRGLAVEAIVPSGNTADDAQNAEQFASARAQWLKGGRETKYPDARRIAAALARWSEGSPTGIQNPTGLPEGEPVPVLAESPDEQSVVLLSVLRLPASDGGGYESHASVLLLAGGRMLELMWTRRGSFTIATLADIRTHVGLWTEAVLKANP